MTQTLKPGDRVRATVEATVATVDALRVLLRQPGENWTFDIIPRVPEVGDVIPRDDISRYTWADGAVLRTVTPVVHAPIHRAGGEWRFGDRRVFHHWAPGTEFEVLAVGA